MLRVYAPAIMKWYDIEVTPLSTIGEVKTMIVGILNEELVGYVTMGNQTILCNYDEGYVYDTSPTISEVGLENGSRLMIV